MTPASPSNEVPGTLPNTQAHSNLTLSMFMTSSAILLVSWTAPNLNKTLFTLFFSPHLISYTQLCLWAHLEITVMLFRNEKYEGKLNRISLVARERRLLVVTID